VVRLSSVCRVLLSRLQSELEIWGKLRQDYGMHGKLVRFDSYHRICNREIVIVRNAELIRMSRHRQASSAAAS